MTRMYFSSCRSCSGLLLVRYLASSSGMMPSNVPPYLCDALPARQVKVMCSSPVPQSQMCALLFGEIVPRRFEQRAFGAARACAPASRPRRDRCAAASGPGRATGRPARCSLARTTCPGRAPAARDRSCRTRPGRRTSRHMPCGLLKLNSCGLGGSKLRPQWVQAKWAERTMSPGCVPGGAALADGEVARSRIERFVLVLDPESSLRLRSSLAPSPSSVRRDDEVSLADAERRVDRFGQPAADARAGGEPVDHHLDVVPHLAVERQVVGERHDAAVDAGADEALLPQVLEQVAVLALLAADRRARARRTASRPAASGCGR